MIENLLISQEFGITPEQFPPDLAGRPYPEQVKETGAAWFPNLADDLEDLLLITRYMIDSVYQHPKLSARLTIYKPEIKTYAVMQHVYDGTISKEPADVVRPFVKLRDEVFNRLFEYGMPSPRPKLSSLIKAKSYPPGGGIGRHGDNNDLLQYPVVIVGHDGNRKTEIITPDGRLLYVASALGGLLVLPQAKGPDSNMRVEHAVMNTSQREVSHTTQFYYVVEGEPNGVASKRDEMRWQDSRDRMLMEVEKTASTVLQLPRSK